MMQWFEDARFWDGFKDMLFGPTRRAAAVAEIDALVALLGIAPPARVLDLCCGVGRHSAELFRRGFEVTGVDLHEPYLAEARSAAPEVEWIHADMREFRRPGAFDVVINMFSSFAYSEDPADDLRIARNAYDSLRAGGAFVIDTMSKEVLASKYQERRWFQLDDGGIMIEHMTVDDGWRAARSKWTILRGDERIEGGFTQRLYAGTELEALLREAGFAEVQLFGWLDGRRYGPGARRLVAVARRGAPG